MPGLDASDFHAFYQMSGVSEAALRAAADRLISECRNEMASFLEKVEAQDPQWRDVVQANANRTIRRRQELIARIESGDPWAWWPVMEDDKLYFCGAWVGQGYWQGFVPDRTARGALILQQWNGETIEASVAALGLPLLREKLAVRALGFWWLQIARALLDNRLPANLGSAECIVTDEWWAENLSGIAWGGGCGQPESARERALYDMRRLGFSWDLACQFVYGNGALAEMISAALVVSERRGNFIGYGSSRERQNWPPVSIGWQAAQAPPIV